MEELTREAENAKKAFSASRDVVENDEEGGGVGEREKWVMYCGLPRNLEFLKNKSQNMRVCVTPKIYSFKKKRQEPEFWRGKENLIHAVTRIGPHETRRQLCRAPVPTHVQRHHDTASRPRDPPPDS